MNSSSDAELSVVSDDSIGFLIEWEQPTDKSNPRDWSSPKKWLNVFLISLQATLSTMTSVILAVSSLEIGSSFNTTNTYLLTLPTALFVLGFGVGPLYLAPLSEVYGRRIIYLSSFILFTLFNVGSALSPNMATLAVFRLLGGMAGSAGPSIGGGSIGDLFTPETRGKAQSVYSFGPTGGSAIGGVIGGFILHGLGNNWRWLAWIMAIASGVTSMVSLVFLDETFGPFLLRKKVRDMRSTMVDERYWCKFDEGRVGTRKLLGRSMSRAVRLLVGSPICIAMSLYMAIIYGIMYLHMVTLPLLFSPHSKYNLPSYHWPTQFTGLSYLGVGIGSLLGVAFCSLFLNWTYTYMSTRESLKRTLTSPSPSPSLPSSSRPSRAPEFRMPLMQFGALIVPLGLFIFAFTARSDISYIVPLIGAGTFSFGMLITYVCVTTYLIDCYEHFAASAIAAMTIARCVVGFVFSFVGFEVYKKLGEVGGTLLLAGMCVVIAPLPVVMWWAGPGLRERGKGSLY